MNHLITGLLAFSTFTISAQAPGDDVFGTNQILTVELSFSQTGFWDSLVANYSTETYMKADIAITDLEGIHNYEDIGIRLKGNSSYGHPGEKKSFKIDFNRYVDSMDYDKMEKLNFGNCFKDPTFMREKIVFDLSREAGVPAPRCIFANVYMNGTFWGFYDVVEQIDDDFLNTQFDNSSENLFKAGAAFDIGTYAADLMYYGNDTASYEARYSLENNATENDWTDLIKLTNFINNASDAIFSDSLQYYFNLPTLMKSLATDNLFANLDAYTNSARNYYIYHNPVNGLWEWIKWDCNEAFGSYSGGGMGGGGITDMTNLEIDYYAIARPLLERIVTITATRESYDYYYCVMKNNYFTSTYIDAKVDELYTLIQAAVYADDNKMYTTEQFDLNVEENITTGGGPGGGTVYGLKSFVSERNVYLEDIIDCTDVGQTVNEQLPSALLVYPNPADDIIYIQHNYTADVVIQIYNMNGVVVATTNGQNINTQFDISALPSGIYIVKISNKSESSICRFVKK